VRAISRFDGRRFSRIQTPFPYNKRRFDTLDGKSGWAVEEDGLRHFHNGKWEIFPEVKLSTLAPMPQRSSDSRVLDVGESAALILFPDHIARFSAGSKRLEHVDGLPEKSLIGPFSTFERGPGGEVWVAGERGVARFRFGAHGQGPYQWHEYPIGRLPVERAGFPVICPREEIFLTAFRDHRQERVILRLWKGRWEIVPGSPPTANASFAWRDGSGDLWLAGNLLYRKSGDNPEEGWVEVESENSALSGNVHNVVVNADGSFFMATPFGVALHVRLAWTPYREARDSKGNRILLKKNMTAMIEDSRQRLWILGEHSIIRHLRQTWEEYSLPRECVLDINQRNALGELTDGRILIQLQEAPYLIAFDPNTLKFAHIRLIDGYKPITFGRRANGQYVVAMESMNGGPDGLGVLDGRGELSWMTLIHGKWNVRFPRGLIETRDGVIWVGGTGGLVRFAHGACQRFDFVDGPNEGQSAPSKIPLQGIFAMLAEDGEKILIGCRDLLCRWNGARLEFLTSFPLSVSFGKQRSGTLWAGTPLDVRRRLNPAKPGEIDLHDAWVPNGVLDGLLMNVGNSVLEDSQGRVWAISGKGPAVFQPHADRDPSSESQNRHSTE
jgi:hypothetical protein